MLGDQIHTNVPFPDQRGKCPYTLIHFAVFHPEARLLNGLATENREWPTHPALVLPVKCQTTTGSIEGSLCTYYLQYIRYQFHNYWYVPNCTLSGMWEHSLMILHMQHESPYLLCLTVMCNWDYISRSYRLQLPPQFITCPLRALGRM